MIRTHRIIRVGLSLSLAFLSVGASAQTEAAGTQALITGDFNIGGRASSVSGSQDKFGEYRDISNGFMLNDMRLRLEKESKPYYMDLIIKNATRSDESYGIKSGSYGKWSFGASFDRMPHNFNTGTLILSGAGTGKQSIANAVQTSLQASEQTRAERLGIALTDTTGEDAQQQAIIRNLLSVTDPTSFKLERERASVNMGYNVTPDVKTWVKVAQERRDGARVIGAGTYERYVQGAAGLTHTEDQFVVTGLEMAEPINYRTTTFNAGAGIYKKGWLVDAEYTLTDFDNGMRSTAWSNPFRNSDASATASNGTIVTKDDHGFNRGRFVNGQMSQAPSSQTHDVSLSGSVELPLHSRFTGNVSYGMTNQNELLLPYTLNTAFAVGCATCAPANYTDASSLPASRFNGAIQTITQSFTLTTKPTEKLGASLKYRYYDYSNRSDRVRFPGYAAFGDSYWRAVKNDKNAAVQNDTPSYVRQTAKLAVDYEIAHPIALEVDALWDRYNHQQQRIDSTDEVGAGAGFVYKPVEKARVHGAYHYAHRAVKNYKAGATAANPEAVGLANFNWADRVRHRTDLRADVNPTDALSVGVAGQYQTDDYGAGERFGFKSQKNLVGSVDATYEASDKVSLSVNYTREHRKGRTQNGAKDDGFNVVASDLDFGYGTDNFNPFNYWNTDITENVDTIGIEATVRPIPEKLTLNMGYDYSESRMRFDTSNPNAAEASAMGYSGAKLANGAAQVWPIVVNKTHEVRASGSYELMKDLTVGLNYLFSWYMLNDFQNTGAYLSGSTPENTTKYVATGASNYNYTAHMVGTSLAYKF